MMNTLRSRQMARSVVSILIVMSITMTPYSYAANVTIPDETTVYLTTSETVIGKKDETAIGDFVRARVWRDVVVGGQIVIKGGTQATVQVSSVTNRKVFGVKGKMSLAAVETTTVDGQTVYLDGGYNKEGKSRMGVALGVGLILFWPALFVPGKAAELPAGTVMDSYTVGSIAVNLPGSEKANPTINLSSMMSGFSVEVLYDELTKTEKPDVFDFLITTDLDAPSEFVIDKINNENVDPIKLRTLTIKADEENEERAVRANVKIKTLAKLFRKGINTFDVSYGQNGERVAQEVVLQVEF